MASKIRKYEEMHRLFLAEMERACADYLAKEGYESDTAFGKMLGLQASAWCCCKGGTTSPLYIELSHIIDDAIQAKRAA